MKIKKYFLFAFVCLLSVFTLVGCKDDPVDDPVNPDDPIVDPSNPTIPDEPNTNNPSTNNQGTNNPNTDNNNSENEITFTELIAIDNTECKIKVTGIDPDSIWGYTINIHLENKSDNKTYMFSVIHASINGIQCDPLFATEVAPGKKSNEKIILLESQLKESGIKKYTDIELTFRVYDSNDWLAEDIVQETINIYPYGEDKAIKYVRESQSTDNIIIDNEYVTAIVTGYEDDIIWGYSVKLFIVNKTNKTLMFSINNASINGYMADPFFATSISKEKCLFTSVSWLDSILEDNGIITVEEIEFTVRVYDANDWLADDFTNTTIILNP